MSVAILDGHDVIALSLALPFVGVGTLEATIDLDADQALTPPSGTVALVVAVEDRPPISYTVTILAALPGGDASRETLSRFRIFAVQGAGAMRKDVLGLDYADVAPRLVAEDATEGEAADLSALASLPSLSSWRRPAGTAKAAVTRLADGLARNTGNEWGWRLTPGGVVTVAIETWPAYAYSAAGAYQDEPDAYGLATLMLAAPDLLPGMTIGRPEDRRGDPLRVLEIVYALDGEKFRARVRVGGAGAAVTTRYAFARAVASVLPPPRLQVPHFASVVDQDSAGNVGLRLDGDDPPLLTLAAVPVWPGLPGVTVRVPLGARCLVTFAGGSEKTPIVTAWEAGTSLTGAAIGGNSAGPLALNAHLIVWAAQVQSACGAIGAAVPPYTDQGTQKLQGA